MSLLKIVLFFTLFSDVNISYIESLLNTSLFVKHKMNIQQINVVFS
jgi:hypothetical protein